MTECDCRRPATPDGIYHESTCALRLTERVSTREDRRAEATRVLEWLGEHGGNVVPFASHYIGIGERRELADAYADHPTAGGTE